MPSDHGSYASALARLGYYSDSFAGLPLMALGDLLDMACDIIGSTLGCEMVLVHFDDQECSSKTRVKHFGPNRPEFDSESSAVMEALRSRLRAQSRMDMDVSSIVHGAAAPSTCPGGGGRIHGAPFNVDCGDGRRQAGFVIALQSEQRNDASLFPLLLEIMAGMVAGAISKCMATICLLRSNRRLEAEITERTKAEMARTEAEEMRHIVDEHNLDWVYWLNREGKVLYANPSCEAISGIATSRFQREPDLFETLIHRDDLPGWRRFMAVDQPSGKEMLDFRIFRPDGRMRWLCQTNCVIHSHDGVDRGIRCSLHDITDRKIREQRHETEALHDPLTGLANRTLCLNRIALALSRAKRRRGYNYAVIFIDLDRFKIINDCLGHTCGDTLLMEMAQRLLLCTRNLDTASRIGGDEFVLLLEELETPREAIQIVKRIRDALRKPFTLTGREVTVTASIGIVFGPSECDEPEDLLRNSNIAMHHAKESGRNHFKVFTAKMFERTFRRMSLEHDMRRAIADGEYFVEYQPIVALEDATLRGFEALVRWRHPERGLVGPTEFIPLAEETGLIIELGRWVLEEACRTMADWCSRHEEARSMTMSVNISGKQFSQPDLVECIGKLLDRTGLSPRNLKLEITETMLMQNPEQAVEKLNKMREMGIKFSIDDFGTGYSSMSYLQRFPLESLKIDFSFIRDMHARTESTEIVKLIISLAHNLGLEVVAEGVECVSHRDALARMSCEYGQGFYFSGPVARDAAERAILSHPSPGARRAPTGGRTLPPHSRSYAHRDSPRRAQA